MAYKYEIEADGYYMARPKDLQNVQRESFAYIGKFWHKHYKAIKFTRRAMKKYNYQPRHGDPGSGAKWEGSYQQSKLTGEYYFPFQTGPKPIKEVKPNVYSGQSRASAMASNKVTATAKNRGHGTVLVHINANRLHFPSSSGIKPWEEVTRVAADEWRTMTVAINKFFANRLLKLRIKKTIKN